MSWLMYAKRPNDKEWLTLEETINEDGMKIVEEIYQECLEHETKDQVSFIMELAELFGIPFMADGTSHLVTYATSIPEKGAMLTVSTYDGVNGNPISTKVYGPELPNNWEPIHANKLL